MTAPKHYQYLFAGPYSTREAAHESAIDSMADGEIDRASNPEIIAVRDHHGKVKGYGVYLDDYHLKAHREGRRA